MKTKKSLSSDGSQRVYKAFGLGLTRMAIADVFENKRHTTLTN